LFDAKFNYVTIIPNHKKGKIMAYTYDINANIRNNKAKNCLITCNTLNSVVDLFVTTFLVAHIYSFNGNTYDYLFNVAVYNIFIYLAFAVFYIPFAKIVDHTNRVWVYRAGIIIKVIIVIIFIFFGKEISKLLILAGFLTGISKALYYSSYNVLKQEMVSRKAISGYSSYSYIFMKLVEVICPITLGSLIDATTFSQTAIIVLAIALIQIGTSFGIKAQKPAGSHYNIKEYLTILKQNPKAKQITISYIISAIYGFSALIGTLINVCVMLEFGTNFSLGAITSIFSIASIVTIFAVRKLTKPGKRKWLFVIAGIIPIISSIIFVITITPATIIILNGTITISSIIYKVLFDEYRNGTLKEAGLYDQIAEHHSIVEVLANLSRLICFILLLIVSLFKDLNIFKIFVVITTTGILAVHMILLNYEKKYINTTKEVK